MNPREVRELLERVQANGLSVDEALDALRKLPYRDVGVANVDHHRALRQGVPEVILGEHKTAEQIATIANAIVASGENVLVTRLDADKAGEVAARVPGLTYATVART